MQIIKIDQELCTGCRRCAEVCPVNAIEGEEGKPQEINYERCVMCGQCVQMCSSYASAFDNKITARKAKLKERGLLPTVQEPLFAAYNMGHALNVKKELKSGKKFSMVQCAPAVRVAIGEEFGLPLGTLTPGKLAAALRKLGFNRVYDTNFAADLTIMEEGNELIDRLTGGGVLPMFTSCCPAWVKFVEQAYPDLLPHLSSCKSPQQMGGAVFKSYGAQVDKVASESIYSVSIMPCTCKKFECARPEMKNNDLQNVDVVLTTRELAQLIKDAGIDFNDLPEEEFDKPLGTYTGAGTIFGVTGGVMEAALRTGYELITKEAIPSVDIEAVRGTEGIREAVVKIGDLDLKVCIVSGLKNVIPVLEKIKAGKSEYHFIEVMTCPVGCVSGGGQPKLLLESMKEQAYSNRITSTYEHDQKLPLRKSHENPDIVQIYKDFLGEPLGHEPHELLHTEYTARR